MTLNKKRIAVVGVLATLFLAMMAGPAFVRFAVQRAPAG